MTQVNPATFQAMVDVATEDTHGLDAITNLSITKRVVRELARKLSTVALLERIKHSRFSNELLGFLPHVLGHSREMLHPVAEILLKSEDDEWDDSKFRQFADTYWGIIVHGYIANGDHRRAWDEIRKAFRGLNPTERVDQFESYPHGEARQLAASYDYLRTLIAELYAALYSKAKVELVSDSPVLFKSVIERYPGARDAYYMSRGSDVRPRVLEGKRDLPGQNFASEFGIWRDKETDKTMVSPSAQMVFEIARYFSAKRDAKRKRKFKQAVAEYGRRS
jgi:hypothetical protein